MRKLMTLVQASLFTLMVLSQPACAAKHTQKQASEDVIRAALQKQFPKHKVGAIHPAVVNGWYEVVMDNHDVIYADTSAKYIFIGNLIDLAQQKSLTEDRQKELQSVNLKPEFDKLPFDDAIKVVRGTGERKLVVFTDPDCPFCKKLDRESLRPITDVTIYYFLYPLDQLHPNSRAKAAKVWCATDRVKAWYDLIYDEKQPDNDGSCPNPMEAIAASAQNLGINGTPGLFFGSGQVVPGAISTEQIEQMLGPVAQH